jgi:uncharacterized membrane protein YgcG
VPVPGGEGFTAAQRQQIDKAIRDAEVESRYEFSVYVGPADEDTRDFAERLHAALVAPSRSVLIMVDPVARVLEVVTGEEARRELGDNEVRLALADMQSQLALGDLAGGIVRGINQLAAHARGPRTLHTSSPDA